MGDFARLLKVQVTSNEGMSNDAPIHECESEIDHYTGHYMPYSLRRVCGFVNVPQIYLFRPWFFGRARGDLNFPFNCPDGGFENVEKII